MRNPTTRARALRKNGTDAEHVFWSAVRDRRLNGFKFRRQVWLGDYIVDFVCVDRKLIVEIDGGQHVDARGYDEQRTARLESLGFRVVRYWNSDVLRNPQGVLADLLTRLSAER